MLSIRAAAAALCVAAAGIAAAERPVAKGEPVIVTATRFEEPYFDRPVNATVISAEDIRRSTARTVPDLIAQQAGVHARDLYGNNAALATVDLRGFGAAAAQNTLILVDGRRVSDVDLSGVQWSAIPLESIERIEIVRGSGAVLYGDGATAGVINIITRSPAGSGGTATLQGGAASYDTLYGRVYASHSAGNLGLGLFAGNYVSDGYRDNNRNRQANLQAEARYLTGGGELSLKFANDSQGMRLPGARLVQESIGVNQLATDRRGAQTPLDWAQRAGSRANLDWRHDLPAAQFTLGLGYRDKEQSAYYDQGGFPTYREADLGVWSVTPRLRLPQPVAGMPNALVAGFDWYRWDYRQKIADVPANIVRPFNTIDATQENIALYLQDTLRVTPRLTAVAGARVETYRIGATDVEGGPFGLAAAPGSRKDREHAWEIALRYQIDPQWAALARAGRSYRFANVDELYEFSPAFAPEFQFLRPQTALSAEFAAEWRAGTGYARAALYAIDVTDEIHLDLYSTGIGNTNLPPSRRSGLELEGRRSFGPVALGIAYTFAAAEIREGTFPGSAFTTRDVAIAGRTVPLVPRHRVAASASWAISGRTRLNASFVWVDEQYMDNDEGNTGVKIPSYAVADVKLQHRAGAWRFTAAVVNLFDEKYYNYAVRSPAAADRYNAYPLPERGFMLTAEYALR
ncbi:MAG: TonB-dependent receptor [Burkholderiales bacterium]|nr:TonB-dependent receptor [Burkholderiales bacterium]